MTHIERLETLDLREAWRNEASDFTPWLGENLDRLGEVIGLDLDIEDTEVSVGSYYADILATDAAGNRRVLIENQLEKADHRHLGQILTYLAGLEAEVIIWIAPDFSEPHLAAIEWLNKHTIEPFAFFAVRLRVVRIGESNPASVFEVVQRPNEWERQIQAQARQTRNRLPRADERKEYWTLFLERHPDFASLGMKVNGSPSQWLSQDPEAEFVVSIYRALDGIGVFLRGRRGVPAVEFNRKFHAVRDRFQELVGDEIWGGEENAPDHPGFSVRIDMRDKENWQQAIDWHAEHAMTWLEAAKAVFPGP